MVSGMTPDLARHVVDQQRHWEDQQLNASYFNLLLDKLEECFRHVINHQLDNQVLKPMMIQVNFITRGNSTNRSYALQTFADV